MDSPLSYEVLNGVGTIMLFVAAVIGLASVAVHTRVPWQQSVMGRHLMAYMAVVAAVLTLAAIRNIFGDSDWFQLLRLIVFAGVPAVMAQRLWLQIKAQREDR